MIRVAFLTEGGTAVGLGHIRRCVTLAKALTARGAETTFYVAGDQQVVDVVGDLGFRASAVGDRLDRHVHAQINNLNAHVVVVDSYSVTDTLLRQLTGVRVMIDDLADRAMTTEIVLNPALCATTSMYRTLTKATLLLGPRFALLRPGFACDRHERLRPEIARILVTMGGGDTGVLPTHLVRWCLDLAPFADVEFVAGPFAGAINLPVSRRVSITRNVDMVAAMKRADLAISAGGQTLFELAAVGLPALVIETAPNQQSNTRDFADAGTIERVGRAGEPALRERFAQAFDRVRDVSAREAMRSFGCRLVDGRGAERVTTKILRAVEKEA